MSSAMTSSAASPFGTLPTWDLTDLYPSAESPEFVAALDKAATDSLAFEAKWKGKLAEAATRTGNEGIGAAVAEYEALSDLMGRIASFAGLGYYAETTNPAKAKIYGDTQTKLTDASAHLLFFSLELNRIEDAVIEAAFAHDEKAAHYRPWIEDLKKDKPFQLEDRVEQLFLEKSQTGAGAFNRLFDQTLASLTFEIDGETLPLEAALNFLQDADPAQRKKAAEALTKVFSENLKLFTLITNTLAKDKEIEDTWRQFPTPVSSRNLANRVEDNVVSALHQAVRAAYPGLSHRYYGMKARWFGQDHLDYWDRNAPLPQDQDHPIAWADAQRIVLDAYGRFSPELAAIGKRFFDNAWIDVPARPGKSPGAFAHPTVPSVHPYLLLNYLGKTRDVMTLAHELGHGVHQILAGGQGHLLSDTPLTLAETASVFGEMLTFRSLLDAEKDPERRRILLAAKVEDMLNTVVRQIAFFDFETRVHNERRSGELTPDRLGDIWMDVQAESLGPVFRFDEGYRNYWSYIPHFIHSPFYVYAYAFGDCLVNSLYAAYLESPDGFAAKYLDMLRSGGTLRHRELLAPFALDAGDPAFWDKGLSVIRGFIDELEAMG